MKSKTRTGTAKCDDHRLTVVDGSELFFSRLAGVTEPEAKRKIIGETCQAIPREFIWPHADLNHSY